MACLLLLAFGMSGPKALAQHQQLFDAYRQEAGDHAALYRGQVENGYPSQFYLNHPYWGSDAFQPGEILFGDHLYTGLQLRYDTYGNHLVVITPEKRIAVKVDMRKVERFTLGQTRFVREGDAFLVCLFEAPGVELMQRLTCKTGTPVVRNRSSYIVFEQQSRFLLRMNGREHVVGSRSSILELFPEHKKALKQYASDMELDFRNKRAEALAALTAYAIQLTSKP